MGKALRGQQLNSIVVKFPSMHSSYFDSTATLEQLLGGKTSVAPDLLPPHFLGISFDTVERLEPVEDESLGLDEVRLLNLVRSVVVMNVVTELAV